VIRSVEDDDPQPNPAPGTVYIHYRPDQKISPEQERQSVVAGEEFALVEWLAELQGLPEEQRPTVAVLVPENSTGFKLTELLQKHGVPYEELLRSTTETRHAVAQLQIVLEYLSKPVDLGALKRVYWSLMSASQRDVVRADVALSQVISKFFARYHDVEQFLWPAAGERFNGAFLEHSWLVDDLALFRDRISRWLEATTLPVDQLVLTISQDLFSEAVDIALGYKVAVLLRDMARVHPDWRLAQFVEELKIISNNERKFIGFDDNEEGYAPKPGKVTVATIHAAKGLEWDRVYLIAVNNYGFPSAQPYDSYIGEKWYTRDRLNLDAELLAQLHVLYQRAPLRYREGEATYQARFDYARERLRLLYVGITRARQDLIVTWNMGKFSSKGLENQPALPLVHLNQFLMSEV
jgi:DNA helicase-2/ATP-dependent DNA helicase PcrA